MKFFLAILLSFNAIAGLPPTTIKGQQGARSTNFNFEVPNQQATKTAGVNALIETGNRNLLANPGFEHQTTTTSWTTSGAATFSTETSNVVSGAKALSIVTSSNSGTLSQDVTTYASRLSGTQALASIRCTNTAADAKLCGRVNGATTTDCVSLETNGAWGEYSVPFLFGGTSSGLAVVVTSSTGTTICDDVYVGPPRAGDIASVGAIGPWTSYGEIAITATTTNPTKPTTRQQDNVSCRVVGEFYECEYRYRSDSATGSAAGSGGYLFALPPGVEFADDQPLGTISTAAGSVNSALADRTISKIGFATLNNGTSATSFNSGWAFAVSGNRFQVCFLNGLTNGGCAASSYFPLDTAGIGYNFTLRFKGKGLNGKVSLHSQLCNDPRKCENVFSARVDGTVSPSTVSNENLDWINGNCTRNATGDYTCNYNTGIFGAQPNCSCFAAGTNSPTCNIDTTTAPTSGVIRIATVSGGGASTNVAFHLICTRSTDFITTKTITGTFEDVVKAPGFGGRPKECTVWFGGAGSLSAPTNCTSNPCTVYQATCPVTSVTRGGAGRAEVTWPSGTWAASAAIKCDCDTATTTANLRTCGSWESAGLVTNSSGGYVRQIVSEATDSSDSDAYGSVTCTGTAP